MAETQVRIKVTTSGQDKLEKLAKSTNKVDVAVGKVNKKLPGAANGISRFGRASAVASKGVKTLGLAVRAALGPIALFTTAVGAISGAFNTLRQQDFAEAKVRTLGVNSEELRQRLVALSAELKGTASVVDLTAASYDVASAGFNSAAEATEVLKAAQLGATGGFADLNTVANATTSVLNAYGLSADKAGKLVDQFIQTQNDGKIVVAEYAANIGKVASAAAGLGIPLAEVNAAIAQSTASGVQAEVAFTGLKSALARLASGEASKALKDFGIEITAASLKSDGLVGTLQKLVDAGLDTGQIFKALGTEAAPALLPLINNLEKTKELVENQKNAAGASARASKEASDTIQGALTRLTSAFQNAFAEQTALGQAFKASILVIAIAIEELTKFVNFLVRAFKALAALLSPLIKLFADLLNKLKPNAEQTERLKGAAEAAGKAVIGFANSIGGLIQRVIKAIPVVGQLYGLLSKFQLLDPEGAAAAFQGSGTGPRKVNYQKEIQDAIKAQKLLKDLQNPSSVSGAGAGSSSSGRQSQLPQLNAQVESAKKLLAIDNQIAAAQLAGNKALENDLMLRRVTLETEAKIAQIMLEEIPASEKLAKIALAEVAASKQRLELNTAAAQAEKDRKAAIEQVVRGVENENALMRAQIAGLGEQEQKRQRIAELIRQGVSPERANQLVEENAALQKQLELVEKIKALEAAAFQRIGQAIEDTIVAGIESAIDGTKRLDESLQEIASNLLKDLGRLFIRAGVSSIAGPGGFGLPGFADGGIASKGQPSLVGEKGPEIITPLAPTLVTPFEDARDSITDKGDGAIADAFGENAAALNTAAVITADKAASQQQEDYMSSASNMTIETQVINSVEYATIDQVQKASAAASKAAQAQMMSNMRNKPAYRAGVGV